MVLCGGVSCCVDERKRAYPRLDELSRLDDHPDFVLSSLVAQRYWRWSNYLANLRPTEAMSHLVEPDVPLGPSAALATTSLTRKRRPAPESKLMPMWHYSGQHLFRGIQKAGT
jgi:hypothetical protein